MSATSKDRLMTIALLGLIFIGAAYILMRVIGEDDYQPEPAMNTASDQPAANVTPAPTSDLFTSAAASTDTAVTTPTIAESEYEGLGEVNLFAPILTPTPPPPTPTPRPTPGPDLQLALKNWKLEYPVANGTRWVFSARNNPNETWTIEVGKSVQVEDGRNAFQATLERDGRWAVIMKHKDQEVRFSMID